ncbi:MAG: hypothetical protein ABJJ09_17505 [Ascidiaceihabitans sp.]|uniref:hypothetical protein n=2 Tax=Ascidiaceihabitans sp. TaxID=1872644 RepID=UPI00329A194B
MATGLMMVGMTASAGHASACTNIWNWMQPPFDTEHIQPAGQQLEGTTGPAQCGTSLLISGARSSHCAYPFEYRADVAQQVFDDLAQLMTHCVGPEVPEQTGKNGVNHPDSYDQKTFQADNGSISLSLKDKGNLNQTYIFLRFDAMP